MKFDDWKKVLIIDKIDETDDVNSYYTYMYKDNFRDINRNRDMFWFKVKEPIDNIKTIEEFIEKMDVDGYKLTVNEIDNIKICTAVLEEITYMLIFINDEILYFDNIYFHHGMHGNLKGLSEDFSLIKWRLDDEDYNDDFLRIEYKGKTYSGQYKRMRLENGKK